MLPVLMIGKENRLAAEIAAGRRVDEVVLDEYLVIAEDLLDG